MYKSRATDTSGALGWTATLSIRYCEHFGLCARRIIEGSGGSECKGFLWRHIWKQSPAGERAFPASLAAESSVSSRRSVADTQQPEREPGATAHHAIVRRVGGAFEGSEGALVPLQ